MLSGGGPQSNAAATVAGSAAASAAIINPDEVRAAGLALDWLRDLPVTHSLAHRTLATLKREFITAGWEENTPIGVGIYRQIIGGTTFFKATYATADGISLLPIGVRLPAGVLPLLRIDNVDGVAAAELAGNTDVRAKLETLVPEHYGHREAVLTDADQDWVKYYQILDAGALPVSVSRGQLATVRPKDARLAIAETMLMFRVTDETVSSLETSRKTMTGARWSGPLKPLRCTRVTIDFLIAEAKHCAVRGQLAEAGFSIGEVLAAILEEAPV
jgi:hypothetical protein